MKKFDWMTAVLGSLLLLAAVPAGAAPQTPIADVENQGDTLIWHPHTQFAQLVLTVTGPCDLQYEKVFDGKDTPFFRLDATTIDGVYRANLFGVASIDPDIVNALQEARGAGDEEFPKQLCRDGKLPGPPTVQTDGFQVIEQRFVYDPGSVEKAIGDADSSVDYDALVSNLDAIVKPGVGPVSRPATKDFVILDDLIVDGSACIGFDCVNGESFGFDTLRLKENNLRIKFDDTSVAASFPRNDWQLTANDSANGGASKFSIDDISGNRTPFTVEANARSHSLYVDDGGRIGSRTSTPSTEIHTIDGDTPTLRLQQDGSSGFAPQTWDVAGNETNFFIRDVSNGSTLPFRIRPGAPTSAIDVASSGNVGLGTASPAFALDITQSAAIVALDSTGQAGEAHLFGVDGFGFVIFNETDTRYDMVFDNDGELGLGGVTAPAFPIEHSSGARLSGGGDWLNASSRALKEDIKPLSAEAATTALAGLDPMTFVYKRDPQENKVGFIAEDVPDLVAVKDRKALSSMDLIAVLTKVVQEQQQMIEDLSGKVSDLEEKLDP